MRHDLIYARNETGQVFTAISAPRGETYYCIQCAQRVILKRGEVRLPHFAHQIGGCGGEQVVHLLAKQLVVHLLCGGHQPLLRRRCASSGCEAQTVMPWELPAYDAVESEWSWGAYRLDVALLCSVAAFAFVFAALAAAVSPQSAGLGPALRAGAFCCPR